VPPSEEQWEVFLEELRQHATVKRAAKAAKIHHSTVYERLAKDEVFRRAVEEALEVGAVALEQEAIRRAVEGVKEPVFYQGQKVDTVTRYSDTLLIFLLKGLKPERYKDRHEHTGPGGGPIQVISIEVVPPDDA
jgi:AcrR family transcriptional regulator